MNKQKNHHLIQDNAIGSGDGTVEGRRYFVAKENFAKFLPISDLTKVDNYAGRPRSGKNGNFFISQFLIKYFNRN